MTDTAKVPRNTEGGRPGRRPLVDDELAGQLLGKVAWRVWQRGAGRSRILRISWPGVVPRWSTACRWCSLPWRAG